MSAYRDNAEGIMDYAKPEFERAVVNEAGRLLRDFFQFRGEVSDVIDAVQIIDNWRASHAFPLNSFTQTLRNRARRIHATAKTPQRIKRLASIGNKLVEKPEMKLSQMQDIGGCRAVMPTLSQVLALRDTYLKEDLVHKYAGQKDYIDQPKDSGYRGIHLKYRFVGSARSLPFDQLKVEIQIRTLLQHKWATAVETAGTFTKEALKASKGSPDWLRFFSLMSSVFASREGCSIVPGTPSTIDDTIEEIRQLNKDHLIAATFSQYHALLPTIETQREAKYFLVQLDPVNEKVQVKGFRAEDSQEANRQYTEVESRLPPGSPIQAVLVSVGSVASLKKAYPNYFLDTADFLAELRAIVSP